MDEQNKNNLEQSGITPPNPDNELTAGTPAPVVPTPIPTPSAATANAEKVLEDKLAEVEQASIRSAAVSPRPAKKRKRWIIWLVIILLIIGGAAAGYFFWYLPQQQTYIPEQVTEQRNATLIYRASTFPTGTLVIKNGVATITARLLNPLSDASYALVLAKIGDGSLSNKVLSSNDSNVAVLVDTFIIDSQGKVIGKKSGDATFAVGNSDLYDTALVMIDGGVNDSIVMEGKLNQDEREPGAINTTLAFPVDLSALSGSVNIKTLQDNKNGLEIAFNELPDIANLGYAYEAHLVQFDGPYVKQDEAIGRFPGNKLGVDVNLSPIDLTGFTNLVISLEPTWDTNKDISQIKPFIAEL